jgi:YARHG domain-containing protein
MRDSICRLLLFTLALSLYLASPVLADEKPQLSSMFPHLKVINLRLESEWSVLNLRGKDDNEEPFEIMALCQKVDGKWVVCVKGGGVFDPALLSDYGVPDSTIRKFYPSVKEEKLQQLLSGRGDPLWEFTQTMPVGAAYLQFLTPWQLTMMRAEIFARHGRSFEDPYLKAYFSSRPWYKADAQYSSESLSSVERENAKSISDFQTANGLLFRAVR